MAQTGWMYHFDSFGGEGKTVEERIAWMNAYGAKGWGAFSVEDGGMQINVWFRRPTDKPPLLSW